MNKSSFWAKRIFGGHFCAPPLLDWSTFERGEIAVQLKDTEGLAEGSVTIKASTLQRIHPALLPNQLEEEYLLPISLKTVVLQVQTHLRQSSEEKPEAVEPILTHRSHRSPVKMKDFSSWQKSRNRRRRRSTETAQAKRKISGPVLTPADRPASPMLRVKSPTENRNPGSPLRVELHEIGAAPIGESRRRIGGGRR